MYNYCLKVSNHRSHTWVIEKRKKVEGYYKYRSL